MTAFGMPDSMFLVFVATLLAGSVGAIHYVVVHVLLGRPVNEGTKDGTIEGTDPLQDGVTDGGSTDGGR
ncbi:hypothetical protein [Halegenticoccus tardaugens]|uniref:hypothetical protein n=1 Tax=Halegenticoccus tardaugens TaxID=2071624 RepID=UPI00100B5568|nr:hypothetical protein [Halegenticoccus tardaugens]